MIKTITYIALSLVLFVTNVHAQEKTFEEKMENLSSQIDNVIVSEKALLKKEIKAIEKQYNSDKITYEEAEKQKKVATKLHADAIKTKIESIEKQVHSLVQGKVDDKVKEVDSKKSKSKKDIYFGVRFDSILKQKKNKRTYSYFVLAFGFNNLIKDGDINSMQDSDFEFAGSRFAELGLNYKTRLLKNSGLAYLNYGLSLRYNGLRAKNNQYLVVNGDQTVLQTHTEDLKKSKFRNTQLVVPLFLEFDLSKPKVENGKTIYRRNRTWRFGFGGFGGINLKSKQILKYKLDGKKVRTKIKGDYNVNRFVYGVQGLVGYKDTSFYVKYDLQDLFADSFENQKNLSFGVRFDW